MQDLARFGVLLRREFLGLRSRQKRKHTPRHLWRGPEALKSSDNTVTSEGRAEPWNSRVGISSGRSNRKEHVEICARSFQPVIELVVGSADQLRNPVRTGD